MIRADFAQDFSGFTISGHAGYAESGADIICAAVSAMTNLVCNAAEAFGADAQVRQEETQALVSYRLQSPCEQAGRLLHVFYTELQQLENQYPKHIRVRKI